ncbi:MAG: HU family DNA-binding protein [Tannerellaceae bacterium]|jgi:nucleoid DNA-binding protein|nr:HU family DNA-binding protein [Tannerellaceae bacterium]
MNNRLTIKELAVELVKSTGKDQESVERFLNEFITVISENIFTDRFVQVKGIGTFKIIQVEKRESIDVNTKERIIIPEHYKLTFSPEKDLKEIVNKPFSFFESIEINDDSDFPSVETELEKEKSIDEDADADDDAESLDTESDIVQKTVFIPEPEPRPVETTEDSIEETIEEVMIPPVEEEKETFVERIEPEVINEPEKPVMEPVIAKPAVDEIKEVKPEEKQEQEQRQEEKVVSEPIPVMNVFIEETFEPASAIEEEQEEFFNEEEVNHLNRNNMNEFSENRSNRGYGREREPEPRGNNNNTLVTLLLVLVVILIVALGSVVYIGRDALFGGSTPVATTTPPDVFTLPDDDTEDESMENDWGIEDEEADVIENPETNPTSESNVIANVQIKKGDRLNLIALDYYGNKLFWVYIYEHNKSKIKNPNSIPVGLELEIPAKSVYNIDANDQASLRRASVLQSQILSKYPSNNRYNSYNDPYGNPYNQYNNPYNQYNNSYNQYSDPYQQYSDPYQNQYQNQNQNQYQQTPNYY